MKKGFTLVELLAVIALLSLIALLVVPNVLEQKEKKEKEVDEATKQILYTDASNYVRNNDYDIIPSNVYCISVDTLKTSGYLSVNADDYLAKIVKITIDENDNFIYSFVDECQEIKN